MIVRADRVLCVSAALFSAFVCSAAQTEHVGLDGVADARVETGYIGPSGVLVDTRPVAEQQLDLTLRLAQYGRLTACGWLISELHGGRDSINRRAFFLFEGTVGYGYDFTLSDSLDFVNETGIVWDSPWGYKDFSKESVGWWLRNSIENPIVVPYAETIGLFEPDRWLVVTVGLRRAFSIWESLVLTPFVTVGWDDADLYYVSVGRTPSSRFLGGSFATMMPGVKVAWRLASSWVTWFRFKEYVVLDPLVRKLNDESTEYFVQNEASVFSIGISYEF